MYKGTRIRISVFLLTTVLIQACLPAIPEPRITAEATSSPPATPTPFQPAVEAATLIPPTPENTPVSSISRVLILSIDGFRPEAITMAPMPNLQDLITRSAYSLNAQTINPSSTLPAHSSMLSGMCPAKHGVTWNDYLPSKGYALGIDIFDLAHAAGLHTLMVVGKEKLRQISEPASVDYFEFINDRDMVIAQTVSTLIPQGFGLFFVHFPTPDFMGHEYGWLSPEQLSVLYRSDEALAEILGALDQAGMRHDTLLIISADHGGHNTMHGSSQTEDITIPWVVSGPGVKPGPLATAINTTDTAATAAWALGLPLPEEWDGIPVLEAFGLVDTAHAQPRCP